MSDASTRIRRLSGDKRRLLAQELARKKPLAPITAQPRGPEPLPLSFSQERLWFLSELRPDSPATNLFFILRFVGELAPEVLEASFQEVFRRHESLRTTFTAVDGKPMQVIRETSAPAVERVSLSGLGPGARQAEVKRLAAVAADRPFELSRGPLLRALLLRLSATEHVLVLVLHHIIADGWSLGVLVHELIVAYQALAHGQPAPLPELEIQYADFALWQRRWLRGDLLGQQIDYWRRQLAAAPRLRLPTDRPRPRRRGVRGMTAAMKLEPALYEALGDLGEARRATRFMTLLAAFAILLSRYSGLTDVVVGSPIANRQRTELEGLIGFLLNTLVLRLDLTRDPSFDELLGRTRETVLEAFAHQDLPFAKLVAELQPERSLGHTPLFDVLLVLQNAPRTTLDLPGLRIETLESDQQPENLDCTMFLEDEDETLSIRLRYSVELFDATTVRRWLQDYRSLLRGIVANPHDRLSELPRFSPAERHQLLVEWNDTRSVRPSAATVVELFARQAARTPEAVAAVFAGWGLSYRELERRSRQLAAQLRCRGAGPERLVGLCAERSLPLVVGVLAILRAGAALLPLDPTHPPARLAAMVAEARPVLLLASDPPASLLEADDVLVLRLDGDGPAAGPAPAGPLPAPEPDTLAYAIHTSGSTGRPKAVMISHRALSSRLRWMQQTYRLSAEDRVLAKASASFDVAIWELLWPLVAGAAVVLARPGGQRDAAYLARSIAEQRVSLAHFVPSLLRSFVEEPGGGACHDLRQVLSGGEALPSELRDRFAQRLSAALHNQYGMTEGCIDVTFQLHHPGREEGDTVPIGRPYGDTRIYLLDPHLQPVPRGARGHLVVGGAGLARGYLDSPQRTADRFVPAPHFGDLSAAAAGDRFYRTGDLARYLADGRLEFLGRLDEQIKLRGIRVEPGEITAALAALPGVRQAVVVAREDRPGELELVAYVVPAAETPTIDALRVALRERLPDALVPAAFVILPTLPLLPNGKLDRGALPAPERGRRLLGSELAPPGNPDQELLAAIWAEVLAIDRVGIDDDFFDLGGHSLLATRVVSRIRRTFGVELPLEKLFAATTVAAQARAVAVARELQQGWKVPPLLPVPRSRSLPLSFAQQRLWFLDQLAPNSPAYNIAGAMRLEGALAVPLVARALGEVLRRHEALRTRFPAAAGDPRQVISPPRPRPLPLVGLEALRPRHRRAEALRLSREEALRSFVLATGPLYRFTLLRLREDEHIALVTMHHVVSDGWSLGIFIDELAALYEAFSQERESPLDELPVQYADFACWQREFLAGEVAAAELRYWRRQLAGAPQSADLPGDRPRPAVQSFRGRSLPVALSAELAGALTALGRSHQVTAFMTLLAAFQLLLSRYSGQQDMVVGSPIAGRNRQEIEGLIGFFVNTLVLRTDLSGDPSFEQLLVRVRRVALDAYAHQHLPFERLVEELEPQRDLSSTPLFQVMFVLQNNPPPTGEFAGLRMRPLSRLAGAGATAKFDLTLALRETDAGLSGAVEFSTDLFDATTIARLLGHFECLLQGIAEAPRRRLSELPRMAVAERHQLLVEWGRGNGDEESEPSIQALFEARVRLQPDRPALVCGRAVTSYQELEARANRVAHTLRGLGVGRDRETVVGLTAERRPEVVVGLLGILKAGGVYLPLDPSHPADRLAFQLDDAGARVLLVQGSAAGRLPGSEAHRARVVSLEATVERQPAHQPGGSPDPDQLAYVIYTSGTTGLPKGVAISHRQVLPVLDWFTRAFDLGDRTRVLQNLSPCFDFGVFELLTTLFAGGTLCFLPAAEQGDLARYLETIEEQDLNTVHTTPSFFRELIALATRRGRRLAGLDLVHLGGEAIGRELWQEIAGVVDEGCRVYNGYGPTETSINNTLFRMQARTGERGMRGAVVPIGRPTAATSVAVLDRRGLPVPMGGVGELCIGGTGVARGYLNRPELTAERFVPDLGRPLTPTLSPGGTVAVIERSPTRGEGAPTQSPRWERAGGGRRLYRSGDLVRWLPDGELEFLGRIDHQVKIRGLRIELGEIESSLARHPSVRHAVALARAREGTAEPWLVAYAVLREQAEAVDAGTLRAWLGERLPASMIPSVLVLLDALPRTATGKIDRRALPEPKVSAPEVGFATPGNPTEELVAEIWAAVLGVGRVGLHDDFFALGGHSLLATRVVSRIRRTFGVELPLERLFATPTVAALARAVDGAREDQQGLKVPPLRPVPRTQPLPLSFAQQRLWFLDQLAPNHPVYNVAGAVRLEGALSVPLVARSWGEVMRRHEALRTRFPVAGGQPRQVISPPQLEPLPRVELGSLEPRHRQAEARRLSREEALRPFVLATGPLCRFTLLRLREDEHVALVTMHHIVSDGWSLGIFIGELAALYEAFSQERDSPLDEPRVQYADFAHWQREYLAGGVAAAELEYWRRQLAGAPQGTELPGDRPRPAVQDFRGRSLPVVLSAELAGAVTALGRTHQVTAFMTLLAAFQLLLSRYSGHEDVVVGSPIAGRNRQEIEALIGFFVNTLVLRLDLGAGADGREPDFLQLLVRVRRLALDAYAHQNLPFEQLVEELAPRRDLSRNPLFQVLFALQNVPAAEFRLAGLRLRSLSLPTATARFDLALVLQEEEAGIKGRLDYNRDLFDPTTILRLRAHYLCLLESAVGDPQRRISQLPCLSPAERHQLLAERNDTRAPAPALLHERLAVQAERTPSATALAFADERLSYGELERRANQLARALRAHGVGPEVRVGICIERSPEMVVAILGVLKAGGAWLPLDPEYPRQRLAFMIADAGAGLILTRQRLRGLLPVGVELVCLDAPWDEAASTAPVTSAVTAENAAYVIYTSGSTGIPKGVVVPHRGLANLAAAQVRRFGLDAGDRILQFSSLSFDASVAEIATALVAGASLYLAPQEDLLPGPPLAAILEERRISCLTLPPTALAVLGADELPALATLLVAGEACSLDLARSRSAGRRLWNAYGPTEAAVCATAGRYDGGPRLPLGEPLANVRVHVLGPRLEVVPIGGVGELCIAGVGVARGYLGRPGLSAERFIPDPYPTDATGGPRLFRTGDLARVLPGGGIEFLGRIDTQIKVRGFRIEPGEIEAVLRGHPGVRQTAVVARRQGHLVAYVVPGPRSPGAGELRQILRDRLPEFMIPGVFVELDTLPRTPSGKVDRTALGRRDLPELGNRGEAPALGDDPTVELLAAIWAEVLDRPQVGLHDDFFELGGHSLLATRVQSRVRETFGVELPLPRLFSAPTLAELAAEVAALRRRGQDAAPPILPRGRDLPLPLSFAQERLWFLDQLEPGVVAYNVPAAVRLRGRLELPALEAAMNEIVSRHEILRTTFVAGCEADDPVQIVSPRLVLALPVVDLRSLPTPARQVEARRLATLEVRRPFALDRGPLLRGLAVRLDEGEHLLAFAIHHIIADGWSASVLVRELAALYQAVVAGSPSPLVALPIQYADFAVWQRQWLAGAVLEEQLAYWRRQLAAAPAVVALPTDRPRPAVQTFTGASLRRWLGPELRDALEALGRRQGTTLFMTLLAAWKTVLLRHTGERDLLVGTPIANRNRVEVEDLIGFFANTLVLRTDLGGDPPFPELLRRVREVSLEAYAHQDLPFERLVDELRPERNLSHSPLFQVLFVLQHEPPSLRLPGLELDPEAVDSGTSKFDLTLTLVSLPKGLATGFEYNTDLFDRTAVQRLAGHLANLLRGIAADGERRLSQLPLSCPAERAQLLAEWNDSDLALPLADPVHRLFECQAERTPDRVALVFADQRLSYGELERRSNQLAHALRRLGVGPEVAVGLCLERTAEMPLAVLGVLKAGGTCVPLDPAYPQERLALMVAETAAPVLLVHERLTRALAGLAAGTGARVVAIDSYAPQLAACPATPVAVPVDLDQLFYVIYTSGSTGKPKGVALSHLALLNLLIWHLDHLLLGARTLQYASLSFDASYHEMFAAWGSGGTLYVVPESLRRDIPALGRYLARHRIEKMIVPVVVLHQLAAEHLSGRPLPATLREITATGEQLQITPQVARLFERLPDCLLHNHYGPSESHVVTAYTMAGAPALWRYQPPIGRPIANSQVYVLDRRYQPTALGVPGELYLGGVCLARGYFDRPALSAERFVPNPLGAAGSRLYRTGDLARWLVHGELEFLGRCDHQLKVRGFRVEPAEIEAVLEAHPEVDQAVVVLREDPVASRMLVAWVVPAAAPPPEPRDLRSYLAAKLPDYMVPSAIALLPDLPLTPNRKVDRAGLSRRPLPLPAGDAETRAPRTPQEELLVEIWAAVLGRERVGVDDDFFELGGHSLLATRLVSRIRQAFRVELPVRAVFDRPTVAGLAATIAEMRHPALGEPIRPAPRTGDLPLSYSQLREWFLDQLEPGDPTYNIPAAVRLEGDLEPGVMAACLNEIVRRHESLRTTFPAVDGAPRQVIAPRFEVPLPLVDLDRLAAEHRRAQARRLAAAEAVRSFDLARGPLLRATLLRLGSRDHVACLNLHHIISDGWSMSILIREIHALYAALRAGRPSPLPELVVQYADYAVAQKRWLEGEGRERLIEYWRRRLDPPPPVLRLPTDRPRSARTPGRGASCRWRVDPALTAALRSLSGRRGSSLFMTLLGALQVLLHRTTGQDVISVGTFIAGRNRPEIEPLIGFFVNTLVLATDLAGDPGFDELLARVREVTLGAYDHQDLPFEMLLDALEIERSLSHTPLFQVMLVLQNLPQSGGEPEGLRWSSFGTSDPHSYFDLTLWMGEVDGGLSGTLDYRAGLFDATTIRRLCAHLESLLRAVVGEAGRPLSALPLLSAAERHQLSVEWSVAPVRVREIPSFCTLFEARAARTPEATALIEPAAGRHLSYRRLNRRANRLAHFLRARGVGPEVRVGLLLERSCDLLIAILATLKAGGAYVPLDPDYPSERLARMADDAGIRVLVSHRGLDAVLGELRQAVAVDRDAGRIAAGSPENPPSAVPDESAAYLIYTSGSAGRPKGVVVTRRSLAWYAVAAGEHYGLVAEDRVLQFCSVSFDASVEEIFPCLARGAALVLRSAEMAASTAEFFRRSGEWSITVASPPTAFWHELAAAAGAGGVPPSLRLLCPGGERMLPQRATDWRRAAGRGARLMNTYGPTETTVVATLCEITGAEAELPIGRPLANVRIAIVDRRLRPVPLGVAGELLIGGDGTARGYHDRPAATAESFVPDPEMAGERLYRTGDLARFRGDGLLELLGRIDDQVKIRGFRIEPGEIEARLGQHPGVEEAAVVAREEPPGLRRLVAYVVTHRTLAAEELRSFLAASLPEYMVPADIVLVGDLPRTPSGKIDRPALRRRQWEEGEARPYAPPETKTEEMVAEIFAELLGRERVGIYDNFFALGGHSLLATRLITRVCDAFEIDLPLRDFFSAPSVARLAAVIERLIIAELRDLSDEEVELLSRETGEEPDPPYLR